MGMNELMTGNRKDHIWVLKHKEKEDKSDRYQHTFYFTLLFSHLADAFIQSDLQIRKSN